MLSVRLPTSLENRLKFLASITNKPKSFYVRRALEDCLEGLENTYLPAELSRHPFSAEQSRRLSDEEIKHLLNGFG